VSFPRCDRAWTDCAAANATDGGNALLSEIYRARKHEIFTNPFLFISFTISLKGGIILIVKKKLFLLTTLAAAITAATIPLSPAFAETGSAIKFEVSEYPSSFVRTLDMSADGLSDYAINGDTYAFASKTSIYVLSTDKSGDRALESKDIGTQIAAVDFEKDKLYFKSTSGNAYAYPDAASPVEHAFPSVTYSIKIDSDLYLLNSETSELEIFNETTGNKSKVGTGFSQLKLYGDKAYAVKDNCPYVLDGATATPLDLGYTDFSAADNIQSEPVATALKSGSYAVKTATLKDGSYYTQIDADDVGQNFKQIKTVKADGAISCLVLFSGKENTDEISVIVAGGNCYVTSTANLQPLAYNPPANDWEQGPNSQRKAYVRERTGVYSSPYMCKATLIAQINAEQAVPVTVVEKFALDFIDAYAAFYRISFTDANGKEVSGFVSASFLDEYDYSADVNQPTDSGTENFKYENNITTVILVLVVVGLVIIAIVYLTVVGTKSDKNAKKKRKKQQDDEE